MKKCKSLLSVFMAVVIAMMCIGITASISVSAVDETVTIKVTPADKASHTYEAYKIFAGTISTDGKTLSNITWGDGVKSDALLAELKSDASDSITISEGVSLKSIFNDCTTAADVAGKLDKEEKDSVLAKEFAKIAAKHLGTVAATATAVTNQNTATITTDKGYGYYLVKDKNTTVGAEGAYTAIILCLKGSAAGDPIPSKSEVPTLKKKIVGGSGDVDSNNASIGDTVTYKLTATIPNSIKSRGYKSYTFTFSDTLSKGLTFSKINSVTLNDGSDHTLTETTNYTVSGLTTDATTGSNTFTVTIDSDTLLGYINGLTDDTTPIIVTVEYEATLNQYAIIYGDGNPNTAHLIFSNDPNGTTTGKTPETTVKTFTYGIELDKVKNDDAKSALTGAKFEITANSGSSLNKVWLNDTLVNVKGGDKAEAEVDTNGKLTIKGLNAGTYTITETETPNGFNDLGYDIILTIADDGKCTAKKSTDNSEVTITPASPSKDDNDYDTTSLDVIKIVNKAGIVLPATGGIGTTIFYIAGGSIMLLAGILFVTKKIVDSKEKKNR